MVFWNKDAAYALSSYKTLAWPVGVWPIDDDTLYSKLRWLFAVVSEILLVITLLMEVYLACENSSGDPIDTYVVTASAMLVLVKLILLRVQRSTLSINLFSAIEDWCNVEGASSREIMMYHARMARMISLSLFYSGFLAFMLYMLRLLPVVTANERTFYLPTSCLFESVSSLQYVLITCYQVIQLFITYAGNCCTEGIFVGITMHLCGQLELLMIDFRQIGQRSHKRKKRNIVEDLVIRHRQLIMLTETIEDTYNVIILTQIFTSAILICVTGFGLMESLHIHDTIMTTKSIVIMIVMLLQSFLYSYAGDNLRDQSEALSFAVYDSNWCDFSINEIKDLTFIMIKTNVPIRLTAGKFFYVTRATFTDILKTAVSYLSALRVMIEKQGPNHARMVSKIWNKEMAREFSLYRKTMLTIGSWPLDSNRNFANFRALIFTIIQTIMVIYIVISLNVHGILSIFVDQFVLASCSTLSIVKITLIRLHRDDLLKNLCNAANNWTCLARQDHRQIMLRYTNLGRFVFFFQMGSAYFVTVSLVAGPLLSFAMSPTLENVTKSKEQMQLPHEMICPSNMPVVCYGIYILQTVQLMFTTIGNVGSDVFLFGVCMHLCGQLEILSLELLQFHDGKKTRFWNKMRMIALANRHCLLLDLAEGIVGTLDTILIAQLVLHALLICLLGLQLIVSLAIHDFVVVGTSIMSFNVIMIQLFLYSYMGETLSSKTEAISQAVYLSEWYNLPADIVRDLCFIIARANVPTRIKAGKFYYIDFNSFKNVLKASVSYFSVMQIMFSQ
ncbi:uncharacterized protein [Anoplolepis gracilipes]|uniref:uncharacterized protein n=1 Tax=Anoplolepis gracilipes TaxID=354296 RepID=UPI003BA2461D